MAKKETHLATADSLRQPVYLYIPREEPIATMLLLEITGELKICFNTKVQEDFFQIHIQENISTIREVYLYIINNL